MDQLTYRELITADPEIDLDSMDLTSAERRDAEALKAEMLALDSRIKSALDIEPPPLWMPDLPAVDTSNVAPLPSPAKRPRSTMTWLGIAASVILVAGLGTRFFGTHTEYASLAEEVVAHLDHEPGSLAVTTTPVADRRLERVSGRSGVEVADGVGLVTYAQSCVINGNTVPHLVIQGRRGPVTLLLLPDERLDRAEVLEGEGINGVLLPVGDGSIAIIGEKDEDIAAIEQQVADSVTWST